MVVQLMLFSKEEFLTTTRGMAQKLAPILQTQTGFKGVTFTSNEETGECSALVFWKSEEDATAATNYLFQKGKLISE